MSVSRKNFIVDLDEVRKESAVGNKARNLSFLANNGYNVPRTLVCLFDAYSHFRRGDASLLKHLEDDLHSHIDTGKRYSVRSSANIEDATSYSFAGQFYTQLNVSGVSDILDAINAVWKSVDAVNELDYIKTVKSDQTIQMGVIIQEMVIPEFSGVIFTRNPLTGLDEAVVEAVDGLGDALVQEGVTPDRWVYKWGDWVEKPKNGDQRTSIILEIIKEAKKLEKLYGTPLDLEWCYDGEMIHWLQLREITALDSAKLFSNKISREFLPGMIKPLVWSVNIPMINSSWKDLFKEAIGNAADSIDVHKLSKQFYYRAYFNMGIIGDIFEVLGMPREALEILAGIESAGQDRPIFRPSNKTFVHLPRMLITALRKLMFSKAIEKFLNDFRKHYNRINSVELDSLGYQETISYIDELFSLNRHGSYMVIVSQLLNSLYNMMLKQMLSREFNTEDLHLSPRTRRLRDSDPRYMIDRMRIAYSSLERDMKDSVEAITSEQLPSDIERSEFGQLYIQFMEQFGHLSDSGNDFSRPAWKETPNVVINLIKNKEAESGRKISRDNLELARFLKRKRIYRAIFGRAMRYQEYRELVNSLYTFGYSQFRRFFLHLADLLKDAELIDHKEDIFYLKYNEVRKLVTNDLDHNDARVRIEQRKMEMDKYEDLVLPEIIIGDAPPINLLQQKIGMELTGVGTAGGHYTGPARVVRGVGDFGKIKEGDVLVIPYSDVSWTPLFSLAKAVISESGGLLSHCSIVAREYGIPAVVSVDAATQIEDGALLAVDGNNGLVLVLETEN